jgi:plastocyanin
MKFRILLIAAALASLSLAACSDDDSNNPTGPPGTLELNSGNIGPGGTFPHRFFNAGAFGYHCTIHSGMNGTVTVSDAATDTNIVVDMNGNAFVPANATVKTGGLVTWTNSDGVNHTVTSH